MKLLTRGSASPKLIKSDKANKGYLSSIVYLAPHKISGKNVCPYASPGCISHCLNFAGRGRMNVVQSARLARTMLYHTSPDEFEEQLGAELSQFVNYCANKKQKPAVRFNGLSDMPWWNIFPNLYKKFDSVQTYEYTKVPIYMWDFLGGILPKNVHLTFSRSELNEDLCKEVLTNSGNVSIVFRTDEFPDTYWGHDVFSMDETDLRFLDPSGVGGLKAKGVAKKDKTGFVVDI